jgi:hypothetical protein
VPQETGARPTANGIADQTDRLTSTARFPGSGRCDAGRAFGKDLPGAGAIPTAKASRPKANLNLAALPGQITEPAIVPTVVGHAGTGARWTARRLRAAYTNDDNIFQLIDALQQQVAWRRQRISDDFNGFHPSTVAIPSTAAPKVRQNRFTYVQVDISCYVSRVFRVAVLLVGGLTTEYASAVWAAPLPRGVEHNKSRIGRLLHLYVERFNQRDWNGLREYIAADTRLRVAARFAGRLINSPYFGNYDRWMVAWRLAVGDVDAETSSIILRRYTGNW